MEITGSPFVSVTLLLAGVLKPSALFNGYFGTYHLHGRHYPLPLLLACFRAYASSNLLPSYLQGSIPGLWLAVTGTGFPPARICDIAQPQPKLTLVQHTAKNSRRFDHIFCLKKIMLSFLIFKGTSNNCFFYKI